MRLPNERTRNLASTLGILALLVAFIGVVLVPGFRLASDLSRTTATLKLVSEQRAQPEVMARTLASLRDQLEAGHYVGKTLEELRGTAATYDAAVAQLRKDLGATAPAELESVSRHWGAQHTRLAPIVGFKGMPYRDSDTAGARMTVAGRELLADTREAIRTGRSSTATLTTAMSAIGTGLEREAVASAAKLRQLMVIGVLFATALVALLVYFQWLKLRHERVAREAQEQTRDILGTVKEGLFLIDSDFRIGQARSSALATLLRRDQFDGLGFDDLLFGLVPEKTLDTALKYVKLFWGERANENLIKSINPLAEVEVRFPQGDIRYLEFDFHRVKGDGGARQVLVSVTDVTSRVLLGTRAAAVAGEQRGADGRAARHPQARAAAAHLVPRRRRGHAEPHELRAQGPRARRRRFPAQDRRAVSRDAQGQGRGSRAGHRVGREPCSCVRGSAAGVARTARTGRQRFPAARRPARRSVRPPQVVARAHAAPRGSALEPAGRRYDDCASAACRPSPTAVQRG